MGDLAVWRAAAAAREAAEAGLGDAVERTTGAFAGSGPVRSAEQLGEAAETAIAEEAEARSHDRAALPAGQAAGVDRRMEECRGPAPPAEPGGLDPVARLLAALRALSLEALAPSVRPPTRATSRPVSSGTAPTPWWPRSSRGTRATAAPPQPGSSVPRPSSAAGARARSWTRPMAPTRSGRSSCESATTCTSEPAGWPGLAARPRPALTARAGRGLRGRLPTRLPPAPPSRPRPVLPQCNSRLPLSQRHRRRSRRSAAVPTHGDTTQGERSREGAARGHRQPDAHAAPGELSLPCPMPPRHPVTGQNTTARLRCLRISRAERRKPAGPMVSVSRIMFNLRHVVM